MADAGFRLNHLNMPARDPVGLAQWYAKTFGLRQDEHRVRGEGVLIVFQAGEPVGRAPELHMGLQVASMKILKEWADRLGGTVGSGSEFASFRTFDPEGNCIEVYSSVNT